MSQEEQKQIQVPTKELLTLLGVIQLASNRGAFRPEEFVEVGAAYKKLTEFLADLKVINLDKSES